ncbi:DUF2334 domain-containing protein [Clostridium cylindrosporum]|uniref:DUF2334 domain-containing protein n=1 Tax=Clostridium cylindrosporum TaxID=1495 RepID=UPI00065C8FE2|nr:DUF2334 domain-containing protein [Clostridium cylindrosporum]
MVKLRIKKILSVFILIVLLIATYGTLRIARFRIYEIKNILVEGKNLVYEGPKKVNKAEPTRFNNIKRIDTKASKVNNISIYFKGDKLYTDIYEKDLRYYVDFRSFVREVQGDIIPDGDKVILNYKNKKITINKELKTYSKKSDSIEFRGEVLNINNKKYISLNDIEGMLDFRDTWNIEKGIINVFDDKKKVNISPVCKSGKAALIRLEDVSTGSTLKSSTAKEKMKILADNLYINGIKFNVAWVPRFKNPQKGIDNDLLTNKTMSNVQFINMMDHLIQKGGAIGLHGYTHQANGDISLKGFELTRKLNSSESETRRVIESGITTAKTLNIPISFFESPHYGATRSQQRIIEDYFNVIYEPYKGYYNFNPLYSFKDKSRLYVPTPLGYIHDKDGEDIIKKIEKQWDFRLNSFFLHPYFEFGFIDLKDTDKYGYRDYNYSEKSPLNRIIKTLGRNGYVTISVKDL